ncbi:hypothetical protein C8F04DRAFT_1183742 [Mycena alexandri]|uniref:Uncharacterized protein n=1 Tax=Mycena alexandri TaxID=1745969 RepID=A0AAD6X378_9AGAR|nr:hypothetical protein C8F04DRAFT_1183742 [Mycena alexandri]
MSKNKCDVRKFQKTHGCCRGYLYTTTLKPRPPANSRESKSVGWRWNIRSGWGQLGIKVGDQKIQINEQSTSNDSRSIAEAREKQRLLMVERRAAAKAHRRQWDPPKKIKLVPHDTDSPMAYVSPEQPLEPAPLMDCQIVGDASITSAEHLAIGVLLEMADAMTPGTPPPASDSEGQDFPPDNPMLPPEEPNSPCVTPSHHSSLEAVEQEPIRRRHIDEAFTTEKLPPNVALLNSLQKKLDRELGLFGPLTWVQQFQMHVATLADSGSSIDDVEDVIAVDDRGPSFLTMSTQRWEQVWEWRQGIQNDTEWDADAQRGFAEAALLARR